MRGTTVQYLIDIPPPTISGELHIGHLLSYSQMDFMARYHRHKGLIYPFCFDNNGLPTEKLAQKANIYDPNQIREFSYKKAEEYKNKFNGLQISFTDKQYDTYSDTAQRLCLLSFEDLKNKNLLYKATTEYWWCPKFKTSISQSELTEDGCYERSGEKAILKTGEGYFINMLDHLDDFRDAINTIEWHPEHYKKRLLNWIDKISFDWNISRERTYGIPIPGEDNMTFDTWFISSLSPQLAWGEGTLECPIFDARFQSHDIIRTWALFTIIKSLYHNNQIPWKHIIISGHALDKNEMKLSKTQGNFKNTDYYLNQYTASGIRYWAALNKCGSDTKIDEQTMLYGKKLINKIRNAKRFLDMQTSSGTNDEFLAEWKEHKLFFEQNMDDYEWSESIKDLTNFFWHTFCDKWIEESKKEPCNQTLRLILDEIILYFAIFLPECEMFQ